MKTFLEIENKSYNFSNCNNCPARCCDGREGTVFSQIILEDFEVVYKNFPILFIFGDLGYLKPVVFFSDGEGFCPYIEDNKCTIYDERPSICRVYPLSPNLDDKIYIDDSCPAITTTNEADSIPIVSDGKVTDTFFYKTLESYQDKYIETHFTLEKLNNIDDFELIKTVNGVKFYKYTGTIENSYVHFHRKSLELNKY